MMNIFLDRKSTTQTHSNDHPLNKIRQRKKKIVQSEVIKCYNAFTLSWIKVLITILIMGFLTSEQNVTVQSYFAQGRQKLIFSESLRDIICWF